MTELAPLYQKTQVVDGFGINDLEEATDTLIYIGYTDIRGNWLVKRIDLSSGKEFRYAMNSNNSSYSSYATAWAARASLSYTTYDSIF